MRKRCDIESKDAPLPEGMEGDLRNTSQLNILAAGSLNDDRIKAALDEEKAMRAFMEDIITFSIAPSHDRNDPEIVEAGVNGVIKKFKRGEIYKVERKFIDSLIRTTMEVSTHNYLDDNRVYQTSVRTKFSLVYPLQIHHDPAGEQGRKWFLFQQQYAR